MHLDFVSCMHGCFAFEIVLVLYLCHGLGNLINYSKEFCGIIGETYYNEKMGYNAEQLHFDMIFFFNHPFDHVLNM